jgi:DNA-binding GntR family transcriptional regulator
VDILDRTLSGQIYARLKDRFLQSMYLPGSRLLEDEIAKEFGVSLTPIREAMNRFLADGLVVRKEHKALYVRTFTLKEAHDVYEMRALLEPTAIELATKHFDEEWLKEVETLEAQQKAGLAAQDYPRVQRTNYCLHVTFAEGSRNAMLVDMIERLWVFIPVLRALAWSHDPAGLRFVAGEHVEIIQCLRTHQAEAAVAAAKRHVESSWERMRQTLEDALSHAPVQVSRGGGNSGSMR